jgi:hypothetical protein
MALLRITVIIGQQQAQAVGEGEEGTQGEKGCCEAA